MSAKAGKYSRINRSGTATAFTTEACTLVSGKIYKITDRTKKVWESIGDVTVYDSGSPVSSADIEKIYYLKGYVEFASGYSPTTPITVTGNYIPMSEMTQIREVSFDVTNDLGDVSTFDSVQNNSDFRNKIQTLLSVSGTISGLYDNGEQLLDYLNGVAWQDLGNWEDLGAWDSVNPLYLEVSFDRNGTKSYIIKCLIDTGNGTSSVEDLATDSYTFQSNGEIAIDD